MATSDSNARAGADEDARESWRLAERRAREHGACVKSCDVHASPASGRCVVVTASADGEILIRERADDGARVRWDPLARARPHDGGVKRARASRDRVASASYDRTARVWHIPAPAGDGKAPAKTGGSVTLRGHSDYVVDCAWCEIDRVGETVVTASSDGTVRIWRALDGECLKTIDVRDQGVGAATCLDAMTIDTSSPDETVLVVGMMDGSVRFFHVSGAGDCAMILLGHLAAVTDVATPDRPNFTGSSIRESMSARVAYGCRDGTLGCFDVFATSGGVDVAHRMRRLPHPDADLEGATSIKFIAPSARTLATASEDGTVRIWDVQRGECTHLLTGMANGSSIDCVSMLADVIFCGGSDGSISVWEKTVVEPTSDYASEEVSAATRATLATRADFALRWLLRERTAQIRFDDVSGSEEALLTSAFESADREANALLAVRTDAHMIGDATCSICCDALTKSGARVAQLPCAHTFHADCVLPWMRVSHQCPLCREGNYEAGVAHELACIRVFEERASV